MRILITGGFGFVGGRVALHLHKAGHQVVLGSRAASAPPNWLKHAEVVKTDWNDTRALEKICNGIDIVIHTAGMNALDSAADPVAALEFNGLVTARIVAAASRNEVKRFIYLSTAHVYASPLSETITEDSCPLNLHPYATSHLAGENAVLYAAQRGYIEGVVLRLSNTFGAPAYKSVNCWELLANNLCLQAVKTKRMVLRSSGKQSRDFITLTDTCRGVQHFLELPTDLLGNGLFNVGGDWNPKILEFSSILQARARKKLNSDIQLIQSCKEDCESLQYFKFSIDKLSRTGFKLTSNRSDEVDLLLEFCIRHF